MLENRNLNAYRQPMVTSLGIIMGFILNFLAGWATREKPDGTHINELHNAADWIVAATLLPALLIMVLVLYRILDIRHPPEKAAEVYVATLRLYMCAIGLAFCGLGVALFF